MINNLIKEFGYNTTKNGIKSVIDTVIKTNSATIYVKENTIAYENLNKLLYRLDKNLYNKYRKLAANKKYLSLNRDALYFIKIDSCIIKIESIEVTDNDDTRLNMILSFYGKDKYKIRKKFIAESLKMKIPNKIPIVFDMQYHNSVPLLIPENNFNDLVLDENKKNKIINGIINWDKSKDWYIKHHLVHKIGVLLYGSPGTGKTSIAKAISNMFDNAPIFTLNFDTINSSISNLAHRRSKLDGVIIVLIEDFDMFFVSREDENVNTKSDIEKKQNVVFQLLDGVFSLEDTIFIATTNYKEKIDPALIRYGRFDIQEEIFLFNKQFALESVRKFGYDEDVLDSFDLEYPVQPAFLQSKIMEHRSNTINNPDFEISMRECVSEIKESIEDKSNIPIITSRYDRDKDELNYPILAQS